MKCLTTNLEKIPWVRHGFFTRLHGTSDGVYGSLNCGVGSKDDPAKVAANRALIANSLEMPSENLLRVYQIHSAKAVYAGKNWNVKSPPEADALVTDQINLGISILTADCAPVLFASRRDKIVGAAHAGWRGAIGGVLDATVAEMEGKGASRKDIFAAIGPCIGPNSYEVSDDFQNPFLAEDSANATFFNKAEKPGHLMFDLPGYITRRLQNLGLGKIFDTRQDTLANEGLYYSYRRMCLRKEPDYGRQISVIAIQPE